MTTQKLAGASNGRELRLGKTRSSGGAGKLLKIVFRVFILFAYLVAMTAVSAQTNPADLDLNTAKFYGHALRDLTIDSITDIFGRPDAVIPEDPAKDKLNRGKQVLYLSKGFAFKMRSLEEDPAVRFSNLTVYLTHGIDERGLNALPFSGTINDGIGKDTKTKRVVEIYKDAFDTTGSGDAVALLDGRRPLKSGQLLLLRKDGPNVAFYYDRATNFIDRINIISTAK